MWRGEAVCRLATSCSTLSACVVSSEPLTRTPSQGRENQSGNTERDRQQKFNFAVAAVR